MSNLQGVLNGDKVALYAEVTANNFILIGGQKSHSKALATEAIDISNKNLPNTRCYMEGEGRALADVTGEILFSTDAAYQFVTAAYESKSFINIVVKKGDLAINPAEKMAVMVTALGDNPTQNEALTSSITFSSDSDFTTRILAAVIAGTFEGTSFSLLGEDSAPWGIAWDQSNQRFLTTGATGAEVFVYNAAGVYSGASFDTSAQTVTPTGIAFDGSGFWVCGSAENTLYRYDSLGAPTGQTIDVSNEGSSPSGLTWDGFNLWVTFAASTTAYKYTFAGVYTGTSFDTSGEITALTGLEFDGAFFWACSDDSDTIYKYDKDGIYTGSSFSVAAQDATPLGIASNGVNLFMVGGASGTVFTYE